MPLQICVNGHATNVVWYGMAWHGIVVWYGTELGIVCAYNYIKYCVDCVGCFEHDSNTLWGTRETLLPCSVQTLPETERIIRPAPFPRIQKGNLLEGGLFATFGGKMIDPPVVVKLSLLRGSQIFAQKVATRPPAISGMLWLLWPRID